MILQDFLAQELVAKVGGGASLDFVPVIGQNIFVGYMPSGLSEGMLFAATLPLNINHYTKTSTGGAQVIYRCSTYEKADKIMRQVSTILSGFEMGSVSSDKVRILKLLPRHEPLTYARIGTGEFEASVNFDVICTFE